MRLSELNGKEIINLVDGRKLGVLYDSEAVVDINQGMIHSLLLNTRRAWLFQHQTEIRWTAVKKISAELILVKLETDQNR